MDWYFNSRYGAKRLDFELKRKLCQGLLTFRCLAESVGVQPAVGDPASAGGLD